MFKQPRWRAGRGENGVTKSGVFGTGTVLCVPGPVAVTWPHFPCTVADLPAEMTQDDPNFTYENVMSKTGILLRALGHFWH